MITTPLWVHTEIIPGRSPNEIKSVEVMSGQPALSQSKL